MTESRKSASGEHDPRFASLSDSYSVVIVGGGINGCGLFRDLCEQNIDCLLIDKNDFCSGASAAPSRLIHGGIKYLETGEFRLVRQSAFERNLLLQNAPHYVKPIETLLPVYSKFGGIVSSFKRFLGLKSRLTDRGAIIIAIGLHLYDFLGRRFQSMPRHQMLSKKAALSKFPLLTSQIRSLGVYHEAKISHAERLGLELIVDGLKANAMAKAMNYVEIEDAGEQGITIKSALKSDRKTIRAGIIVNAGGAWIDKINSSLGLSTQFIGGNKGSHLIVKNQALYEALQGRMVYYGSADGRVNLLYPFMGNVLIGSTDIPQRDVESATCSQSEIDYMIETTREVFPTIPISPDEVMLTYCGVRPLPASDASDPGDVSRDHSIAIRKLPGTNIEVMSLIGGKWTTFRGFSQEVADLILARMGKPRIRDTVDLKIGGGAKFPPDQKARIDYIEKLTTKSALSSNRVSVLFERYGTKSEQYIENLSAGETLLASCPSYSAEELRWIAQNEHVIRLSDVLFRRTEIVLSGLLTEELIEEAAQIIAFTMGWDEDRTSLEKEDVRSIAARNSVNLRPNGTATHC